MLFGKDSRTLTRRAFVATLFATSPGVLDLHLMAFDGFGVESHCQSMTPVIGCFGSSCRSAVIPEAG
jgi:hypothetical protein